jgi:hypothetical protein
MITRWLAASSPSQLAPEVARYTRPQLKQLEVTGVGGGPIEVKSGLAKEIAELIGVLVKSGGARCSARFYPGSIRRSTTAAGSRPVNSWSRSSSRNCRRAGPPGELRPLADTQAFLVDQAQQQKLYLFGGNTDPIVETLLNMPQKNPK